MKKLAVLILLSWALASPASAIVRDVCKDTGDPDFPCTHSSIGSAETASAAGDIIEIRDSDTYDEEWLPGGERTLRNKAGDTPTIKMTGAGNAVNLNSAGVGPVSILGVALNDITLDADNGDTISATITAGAFTIVIKNVHILNSKINQTLFVVTNLGDDMTGTFTKCLWGAGTAAAADGFAVLDQGSGSVWTFENNYFHDIQGNGIEIQDDLGAGVVNVILKGVTIRNCGNGINTASRISGKHVLLQDNTDDFVESGSFLKSDFTFSGFEEEPVTGWPASIQNGASVFQDLSDTLTGYRLVNGSFGIDDGNTTGIADDIEGTSRPQGTNFDFGAFEALAASAPTNMVAAGAAQNIVAAGVNQKIVD